MVRRLGLSAALCLAVAACSGADTEERPSPAAGDPTAAVSSPDLDGSPSWYGQRLELPSCGADEEYGDGYPNREARACFQDAFAADRPAELTRLQFGDEGESIRAHFRVLGDGRYEIVGEQFPSPVAGYAGGHGWVHYECTRFVFSDVAGAESAGTPWINAEGECELVEYVAG